MDASAPTEENTIVDGADTADTAAIDGGDSGRPVEWAPAEEPPAKKRHIGRWVGIGLGVLALGIGAASTVLIAPGTTIAGVSVGFMTAGAAAEAVSSHVSDMQVSLTAGGTAKSVTGSDLGAHVDAAKLADQAFSQHPMWNITSWMPAPIKPAVTLDARAAEHALRAQVPDLYKDSTDATVVFDAAHSSYVSTPAHDGTGIDLKALAASMTNAVAQGESRVSID
ncbi:MAG: murein L,D-transpeptidase, partial [Actinobacteria bacterium]|nr:murein L,D-transpeptidase [Actinomycetota bacterium]